MKPTPDEADRKADRVPPAIFGSPPATLDRVRLNPYLNPYETVCHALRASRRASRLTAVWLLILLSACSPAASASPTTIRAALGLAASSSGVCEAIAALPDVSAAQRAFTNVAHDALHGLAADPRLDRAASARVLETMQQVEADFEQPPGVTELTADLTELRASADAALQALGVAVPACAR